MLEVKNLEIIVGTRILVDALSFTLKKGDKLAIIGEEGNGKTTLLKSLLGLCDYSKVKGMIDFKGNRVGYLEQKLNEEVSLTSVKDYLSFVDGEYYEKVGYLYRKMEELNLDEEILERQMSCLSGGERVKIQLLKLLLDENDILFLDEPTNDLDIDTLEWLERFISIYEGAIVYVSHDETLLSHTANMILHIEQIEKKTKSRCTVEKCGYDEYVGRRSRSIEKQIQMAKGEKRTYDKKKERLDRIMKKVEYQQNTISRADPFRAKGLKTKMHSLKAQEKRLYNTELTSVPDLEESISFSFPEVYIPKGKKIIEVDIPLLEVSKKVLSRNIHLDVIGDVHLAIVGKNGVGKSTLLKYISDRLKQREDIKVGYMPQNYDEIFKPGELVLDFITTRNVDDIKRAKTFLSSMKFTYDEIMGKIENLSNGTKAKLILMKSVLEGCNVLVLDEPTRNLSPLSNPVIRRVLREFKGTIISVSHDRKYLEEVIDVIYTLDSEGLRK